MNIVILTSYSARHLYFAYEISKYFSKSNCYFVQEPKSTFGKNSSLFRRICFKKHKTSLVMKVLTDIIFSKYINRLNQEKNLQESLFFGQVKEYTQLYEKHDFLKLKIGESINCIRSVKWVSSKDPDIIVVMGTSLLKKEIISLPSIAAVNLHTGISPYYRGGMTNLWPIINHEPQYCGVTVHQLNLGIDAGKIIKTLQTKIEKNDNFSSINSKSIISGTKLMNEALERILDEGLLKGKKQWTKGRIFHNRNFNGLVAKKYFQLLDNNYIEKYLITLDMKEKKYDQPCLVN